MNFRKLDIQVHEYLFNVNFENLWSCPTHAFLERHANACHKWIHRIKEDTIDVLESAYYVLWDILHRLWPRESWDDNSIPLKSCLKDLDRYIDSFRELVEIVDLVKKISDSGYVKRHKEYLLRQLWRRARENSLVERRLKRGYGPHQWKLKANLNVFEVFKRTKDSVDFWLGHELEEIKDTKGFLESIDALIAWDYFVSNNFKEASK